MNIRSSLDPSELRMLQEILSRRNPGLLSKLDGPFDLRIINEMRDELGFELAASGWTGTGPNERGLAIEDLIDKLFELIYPL
jgi:hypothetical protein